MCLKTVGEMKIMKDYRIARKYDILIKNGKDALLGWLNKNAVLYYVKINEMFDIFHETHFAIYTTEKKIV